MADLPVSDSVFPIADILDVGAMWCLLIPFGSLCAAAALTLKETIHHCADPNDLTAIRPIIWPEHHYRLDR